MRNFYIGWSRAELEAALRTAQNDLAAGASLTGGAAGDQNFTQLADPNTEATIARLLYALFLIDPEAYPARDCNPASRTRVVFQDYPGA